MALKSVDGAVAVGGGMFADPVGFGRTHELLSFLTYRMAYLKYAREHHLGALPLSPANLIVQWAKAILGFGGFNLIIAYGHPADMVDHLKTHVMPTRELEILPNVKAKGIAPRFRKILDPNSPNTSCTIILSSYNTGVSRLFDEVKADSPPLTADQKYGDFFARLPGFFTTIVGDEGHYWKNNHTYRHALAKLTTSQYLIDMTATPMLHTVKDTVAQLMMLLYDRSQAIIPEAVFQERDDMRMMESKEFWEYYEDPPDNNPLRAMALDSWRVESLLNKDDEEHDLARWFPLVEDIVMLKRNGASQIPINDNENLNMKDFGKGHTIRTIRT